MTQQNYTKLRLASGKEWPAAVEVTMPVVERQFTVSGARLLLQIATKSIDDVIDGLAKDGDIQSLKNFIEATDNLKRMRGLPAGQRGAIVYAVVHMLVDGSGNDAFAREWMDTLGHTAKAASDRLDAAMAHFDKHSPVEMQRLWGLVQVAGNPFECMPGAVASEPAINKLLIGTYGISNFSERNALQSQLLAELLVVKSPDKLPDFIESMPVMNLTPNSREHQLSFERTTTPLAHAMWTNKGEMARLLPAVAMAYGACHAQVRMQMNDGFAYALMEGAIDLSGSSIAKMQMAAIEQGWIEAHVLDTILDGKFGIFTFKHGQSVKVANATFLTALAQVHPDVQAGIVGTLRSGGVDVNRQIEIKGDCVRQVNLAYSAVNERSADLFIDLLSHGCDPTVPCRTMGRDAGGLEVWVDGVSAADELDKMMQECREDLNFPVIQKMSGALGVWRSRQAAYQAISEFSAPTCASGI